MNSTNEQPNEVARLMERLETSTGLIHEIRMDRNAKTAEVARLRELLNRAIEIAEIVGWTRQTTYLAEMKQELHKMKEETALAPAPEETHEGVTMDEWYGRFSKIESTETEASKLKAMVMDAARRGDQMAAHWKERAEKAEALVKQIHHYAGIIEGFQADNK